MRIPVAWMATFPAHRGRNTARKTSQFLAVAVATLLVSMAHKNITAIKTEQMTRDSWLCGKDISRNSIVRKAAGKPTPHVIPDLPLPERALTAMILNKPLLLASDRLPFPSDIPMPCVEQEGF